MFSKKIKILGLFLVLAIVMVSALGAVSAGKDSKSIGSNVTVTTDSGSAVNNGTNINLNITGNVTTTIDVPASDFGAPAVPSGSPINQTIYYTSGSPNSYPTATLTNDGKIYSLSDTTYSDTGATFNNVGSDLITDADGNFTLNGTITDSTTTLVNGNTYYLKLTVPENAGSSVTVGENTRYVFVSTSGGVEVYASFMYTNPAITIINTTNTIYSFIEGSINIVNVTLYDADGKKLSRDIYYTIDDGKIDGPTTGGITIQGLSPGEHALKFYFEGDTDHAASNNQTTINIISNPVPPINPTATVLTGEDLTTNKSTVDFTVTLKTVDGDVLGNESVLYILYNDEYHPVTTDSNGVATVTLNNLTVGSYSIRYVYFGNSLYASCNGVSTINVVNNSKADSNLKTGYEGNVLSFNLTSEGQALSNQNISVNINGTQITLTTDKDGLASINLNNYTPGNYTVNYDYLGNEKVNGVNGSLNLTVTTSNITDLSTVLSVNNLTMTYGEALNLTGTLLDINGNPVSGMHIALNLTRLSDGASKIYSATTSNKGEYELEINLYPGEYSVSASFNGLKTNTNNYLASGPLNSSILVNKVGTVLSADKFTEKFGANQNFTGKLVNSKGEAVIGQHILLKLTRLSDKASKIYDVTTDTNGEYQLPINLFKGKYTAECSYAGTSIYTSSDASNSITVTA